VKPKNQGPQDNLKIFGTKLEAPVSNHKGTCEGSKHDKERWDLQTHEVDAYTHFPLSEMKKGIVDVKLINGPMLGGG
jgi:hypothetical protein